MLVKKDSMRVAILEGVWDIECDYHSLPGSRLTDSMNSKNNDFVAITNVVARDSASGQHLFDSPFMDLNRLSIVAIRPLDAGEASAEAEDISKSMPSFSPS